MEEKKNEQALGKFKSTEALMAAYKSLESEFTRRSQKLRKLEKELASIKKEAKND